MIEMVQRVSNSLTSNMALLDSRRSIAKAHSVAKLTELAFFFIPLTFVASLFGMQIEEFEQRAPLKMFIMLGIAFISFAYLVRLVLRSRWLRHLNQYMEERVRWYADRKRKPVQRGYIPTSLLLQWCLQEVGSVFANLVRFSAKLFYSSSVLASVIFLCLVSALPLALIWTQRMGRSARISLTIAVLVSVSLFFLLKRDRLLARKLFGGSIQ